MREFKGPEKRGRVHFLGKQHQASSSQSSYANNRIQKLGEFAWKSCQLF